MSVFSNFVNNISRFQTVDLSTIVQNTDIAALTTPAGKAAVRVNYHLICINESLQQLSSLVALIGSGPQAQIKDLYMIISKLSNTLTEAIAIIDTYVPDGYKCTAYVNEMLSKIGQFQPSMNYCISPTAPTYAQYIPSFQTIFSESQAIINQLMPVILAVPQLIKKSDASIDSSDKQIHRVAALIYLSEILYVDIVKFINDGEISAKEDLKNSLEQWLTHFSNFTNTLVSLMGNNSIDVFKACADITNIHPSITDIFNNVRSAAPKCASFNDASTHLMMFTQILGFYQFNSTNVIAEKASNIIAQSVSSKDTESIQNAIQSISHALEQRLNLEIYGVIPNDLKSFIKSVLSVKNTNHDATCINASIILILYSITCSDLANAYKYLQIIISQCIKLLIDKCSSFKQLAATASTIISANESVFDTKKLAFMNYYLNLCLAATISDRSTLKQLQPLFVSAASLPYQIELISDKTEVQDQFKEVIESMKTLGTTISNWLIVTGMAINSLIVSKSETLVSLLAYITTVNKLNNPSTPLVTLLQSSPHYIYLDISAASRLQKSYQDIEQAVKSISNSESGAYIKPAVEVLYQQNQTQANVKDLVASEDPNHMPGLLYMIAQRLLNTIKSSAGCLDNNLGGFLYEYSFTFSFSLYVNCCVEFAPQITGNISTYPGSIKGYNDVIYPAAIKLTPQSASDAGTLKVYLNGLNKSVMEMNTAILAMPQPSKTYEISEELKAIRSMQAQNNTLAQPLKPFGQKIISKALITPSALPMLTPWFQVATQAVTPVVKAAKAVADSSYNMISGKNAPDLVTNIQKLMVSIIQPDIADLAKFADYIFDELLNHLVSFVTHRESETQKVRLIYAKAREVMYMAKYITVKDIDAPPFVHASIASCVKKLSKLYVSFNVDTLCDAIASSSCYVALAQVFPGMANNTVEFIHVAEILSTIMKADGVSALINQVAQIFVIDTKSAFSSEIDGNNKALIIDLLYEHFEVLRFSANTIIKCLMNPEDTDEYLVSTLRQFMISAASYILLVSLGIKQTDYVLQRIIETANCFNQFALIAKSSDKQVEQLSLNFRRNNRIVSRQVDTTINLMESPDEKAQTFTGFKAEMQTFYSALIKVLVECIRRVVAAVICLHKDSYKDTTPMLTVAYNKMNEAFNVCKEHAIGKTKKPFQDSYKQLTMVIDLFAGTQMDYNSVFPPMPIIDNLIKLMTQVTKFLPAAALATDVLIIDPDPVAASRVPDYNPSFNVQHVDIAPGDALQDQNAAVKAYNDALTKYNAVLNNEQATSEEILEAAEKLRIAADNVLKASLTMANASQEKSMQVAQQTNAHALSTAIGQVLNAVKSRLLREKDHVEKQAEAQQQLKEAITRQLELATQAAAYVPPEPEPEAAAGGGAAAVPDDEVSAELMATASAISDMSSRLAMFSSQLGSSITIEQEEIPDEFVEEEEDNDTAAAPVEVDVKAEEGSMAAYIIACATPIMQTAGEILEQSQKICAEMRGKIHNEAFIIKCAHDVTEAAQLLIIAAETAVNNTDPDPEFIAIAASNIVKTAIASIVAQVLQSGGDSEAMMKKTRTVRFYCLKINKKVEAIAKQKWITANPVKKSGAKMVQKMNAMNKLKTYQDNLDAAERARKMFKRK